MARTRKHRPHRPDILGPRLYRRGRWYACDTRPWGGKRETLRDPSHPNWPAEGERTEHEDVALQWRWSYVSLYQGEAKDRQLGIRKARPLGVTADAWLRERSVHFADNTWRNNRTAMNRLMDRFGRSITLDRIRTQELQAWFNEMAQAGYSPRTLVTMRLILSAFFRDQGGQNPTKDLKLPKVAQTEDIYAWSDDDIERLRKAADRLGTRLEVELLLNTGARVGEAAALRWSDFKPDQGVVRITRQLLVVANEIAPPKGKKGRTAVVLPDWWSFHRQEAGRIVPWRTKSLQRRVSRTIDAAGLGGPGRGPHDARRTYGRLFLERHGGWLDELQGSLGHKSITTTERQYAAWAEAARARAMLERMRAGGRSLRALG